jgi:hypothetical protein
LPVVLYRCENWSLTFSEERTVRGFGNGVLRGILGFKGDEVMRSGENYMMRSLIICFLLQYYLGDKIEKRCSLLVAFMRRGEEYRGDLWGNVGKKVIW